MQKFLLLLALVSGAAFGQTERVIINPESNGNLKIKANVGGTATDIISVTGSTGNVTVSKIMNNASMPAFHVNKNGTSQAGSGASQIDWGEAHANAFDQGDVFANPTAHTFKVPTGGAGVYQFNASLYVRKDSTAGSVRIFLRVNGSATRRTQVSSRASMNATDVDVLAGSAIFKLADGDTVDMLIDSASAYTILGDVDTTHFSGAKIH